MDHFGYREDRLFAEDVALETIAEAVGTPCYVYSRATLERHYRAFDEPFGNYPHHICYAVKANDNLAVLQVLQRLGAGFDIVSGGELDRVLAVGATPGDVVFSGVGKSVAEIEQALCVGVRNLSLESEAELERVFDICHTCRRCVSLCNSFPTLFDLVDDSETMEVDGVAKADYTKVVDQCYLCDLCYLTKCPYVPPHEWNVDFPHLMLRAKAIKFKKGDTKFRDRIITSTDTVGKLASKPVLNSLANWGTKSTLSRKLLDSAFGIHKEAKLPPYNSETAREKNSALMFDPAVAGSNSETTTSNQKDERVTLFTTCYCNYNEPSIAGSLIKVLQHNKVEVELAPREHCCGMPKLELGDLKSVTRLKEQNIPILYQAVLRGNAIVAAVPSCVLMFKQELPLMFPDDDQVQAVAAAFFDPFEFLYRLNKEED